MVVARDALHAVEAALRKILEEASPVHLGLGERNDGRKACQRLDLGPAPQRSDASRGERGDLGCGAAAAMERSVGRLVGSAPG